MKHLQYLEEADKITRTVDHLLYVTFSLIKDKHILIKILTELKRSLAYCINSILQYEYLFRRINLYKDPKMNFKTFLVKCSPKYNLSEEETNKIKELFGIIEQHNKSSMEFTKNEKLVIMTETQTSTVGIEKLKEFLSINKKLIRNIKENMKKN